MDYLYGSSAVVAAGNEYYGQLIAMMGVVKLGITPCTIL